MTTIFMERISRISDELWEKCHSECDTIPNPVNWLFNQDSMIMIYESSKFINDALNAYSSYMNFMYHNYPRGFGKKTLEYFQNKVMICDGVSIYNEVYLKSNIQKSSMLMQKTYIVILKNDDAKKHVMSMEMMKYNKYVELWLKETNMTMCIILCKCKTNLETTISFALLHKMDFDPVSYHVNPILMDYIYTFNSYRNNGYASILIKKIKKNNQVTAFCNSLQSEHLFAKNGYNVSENGSARYP